MRNCDLVATPNCKFYEAKLSVCDHFSTQKIKFTSCQISWLLQTVLLNCFALLWNYKHFKTAAKRIEIWTKQAAVQVIQTVTQKKKHFQREKNKIKIWVIYMYTVYVLSMSIYSLLVMWHPFVVLTFTLTCSNFLVPKCAKTKLGATQ